MVNLNKPLSCHVDFKEGHQYLSPVHFHIEIVLIDKTTSPLDPCLYQLNIPNKSQAQYNAFTKIGTAVSIDTHKKTITLENRNTVTYQHMIIATGPQSAWMNPLPDKEFAAGIQVLMEALRMQEKKPLAQQNTEKKNKIKPSATKPYKRAVPKPKAPDNQGMSKNPKRVYQVQL
jgi:NADH dehydrogenase FAD-containing subunit